MKKTLYLECYSGISGDMTVAALLDLGANREVLDRMLRSLPLEGFRIRVSRVKKSGVDACDFDVILDEAHENHDHDMEYLFGQEEHGHHHEAHEHHHEEHGHHHDGHEHHHEEHGHHHGHEHRGLREVMEIIEQTKRGVGRPRIDATKFNLSIRQESYDRLVFLQRMLPNFRRTAFINDAIKMQLDLIWSDHPDWTLLPDRDDAQTAQEMD